MTTALQITDEMIDASKDIIEPSTMQTAYAFERLATTIAGAILDQSKSQPAKGAGLPGFNEPVEVTSGADGKLFLPATVVDVQLQCDLETGQMVRRSVSDEGVTWRRVKRVEPAVEPSKWCSVCKCDHPIDSEPAQPSEDDVHASLDRIQAAVNKRLVATIAESSEPAGEVTTDARSDLMAAISRWSKSGGTSADADAIQVAIDTFAARATAADKARIAELETTREHLLNDYDSLSSTVLELRAQITVAGRERDEYQRIGARWADESRELHDRLARRTELLRRVVASTDEETPSPNQGPMLRADIDAELATDQPAEDGRRGR